MAREIETGEIVALKKIRMDNEREGVCISFITSLFHSIVNAYIPLLHFFVFIFVKTLHLGTKQVLICSNNLLSILL